MTVGPSTPAIAATRARSGRYLVFHAGRECGEERWRLEATPEGALLTGEQITEAPHPFPSRHEFRARLDARARVRGVEILWTVGPRAVRATHAAEAGRWHVRIEYQGERREQQGDYPEF